MSKIPQVDSIAELARFWDTHDLSEFEAEIEEVAETVFDRTDEAVMQVRLDPEQAHALHSMAQSKEVDDANLIKEWVSEKLRASVTTASRKSKSAAWNGSIV